MLNELSCNVERVLVTFLADNISILSDLHRLIPVFEKGKVVMCLLLELGLGP